MQTMNLSLQVVTRDGETVVKARVGRGMSVMEKDFSIVEWKSLASDIAQEIREIELAQWAECFCP